MSRTDGTRLGFISHSPWIAGAERALVNILQHLPAGQAQAMVIFPEASGPLKAVVKDTLGLPVFDLPYSFSIPIHGQPSLCESKKHEIDAFVSLYKELELDGVIVNTGVLFPASVAAALVNLPLIVHSHGVINQALFPGLDTAQWNLIDAIQLQIADTVIVPSAWIARHYSTFCHVPESRIRVLPNGTYISHLPNAGCSNFPGGPPKFSMLCTLEPNKGVETVVEAASIVLSQRPNSASFVVYGDGAPIYRNNLKNLIRSLGLEDSFLLRNKQLDVSSIYNSSYAVIVASHIESFSFVAIEAMSHCRPVIATRCGGPDEIIDDGETGFLIEVGDAKALARRILDLIESPLLCEQLGRSARAVAEKRFDIQTIAGHYLSTILAAVNEPRTREWASRRRHLASLLLEGVGSSTSGDTGSAVVSRVRAKFAGKPVLSSPDVCETLELLRLRLHAINEDVGLAE
jgi:glycosyltransferase involved in cell wall biosynthesis